MAGDRCWSGWAIRVGWIYGRGIQVLPLRATNPCVRAHVNLYLILLCVLQNRWSACTHMQPFLYAGGSESYTVSSSIAGDHCP